MTCPSHCGMPVNADLPQSISKYYPNLVLLVNVWCYEETGLLADHSEGWQERVFGKVCPSSASWQGVLLFSSAHHWLILLRCLLQRGNSGGWTLHMHALPAVATCMGA